MSSDRRANAENDNTVEIRLAVPDDAEAISRVLAESFSTVKEHYTPEAFVIVTPSPDVILERFSEGPMWVAVSDGEIVGTGSVLPEPDWLYLRSMALLPQERGRGIGDTLLKAIEKYARKEGFDRLLLYTTYFSTGAIQLYEKHGFIRGRDTTADEWYGTPGLAMDKVLERKEK